MMLRVHSNVIVGCILAGVLIFAVSLVAILAGMIVGSIMGAERINLLARVLFAFRVSATISVIMVLAANFLVIGLCLYKKFEKGDSLEHFYSDLHKRQNRA